MFSPRTYPSFRFGNNETEIMVSALPIPSASKRVCELTVQTVELLRKSGMTKVIRNVIIMT